MNENGILKNFFRMPRAADLPRLYGDEDNSFPRASLSENCSLLGTDSVRGQISEHIFAPNEGYCLYSCQE